jgi:hypothetical protein
MARRFTWLFAIALLLGGARAPAQAQECSMLGMAPTANMPPGLVLRTLMRPELLGDSTCDKDALTQGVFKDLVGLDAGKPELAVKTVAAGSKAALTRLSLAADELSAKSSAILSAQWLAVAQALRQASGASGGLAGLEPYALAQKADDLLDPALLKYEGQNTLFKLGGVEINFICGIAAAAADCADFEGRKNLWRVFRLTRAAHAYMQTPANDLRVRAYQVRLARWDAYRTQSLHQTWWELGINSWNMNRDSGICPRDDKGQRQGFCDVPTTQLIAFHPDVGLRYSRNANASSELKPYLVLELLGRYHYTWKADADDGKTNIKDLATVDTRWGYSLAAAYGFDGDRNRWSYGPMFRWKGYNLAFTRSTSGRWALLLNTSLSDAVLKADRDWIAGLQRSGL